MIGEILVTVIILVISHRYLDKVFSEYYFLFRLCGKMQLNSVWESVNYQMALGLLLVETLVNLEKLAEI